MIPAHRVIDRLVRLSPDSELLGRAGLTGPLHLLRAWPRDGAGLLLEYRDRDGRRVAGQWFADPAERDHVARGCRSRDRDAVVLTVTEEAGSVLLQPGGADHRLRRLLPVLRDGSARLVSHRPGRRAVVVHGDGPSRRYRKVVRPTKHAAVVRAGMLAARVSALPVPQLLDDRPSVGHSVWSAVAGEPLTDVLDRHVAPALEALGAGLRRLHSTRPPPAGLPRHDAAAEARTLRGWVERTAPYRPGLAAELAARSAAALAGLPQTADPALVHRDLHDRQVIVAGGEVGWLDFDTLAVGDPALDLGNLGAHLRLRGLQGRCDTAQAAALWSALLDGYQPDGRLLRRADAYAEVAALRLVCVHALRPADHDAAVQLLAGPPAGSPASARR